MGVMIGTLVAIIVVGIPFTLWWWKVADRGVPEKYRRFKPKARDGGVERIVVRNPDAPADPGGAGSAQGGDGAASMSRRTEA